jgi:hypothetical protein
LRFSLKVKTMRAWVCRGVLCGLALTILPAPAPPDELASDPALGKNLLREGDALADKGESTEAVIHYQQAFEQLLPGMRKLHFKHEVKRDVTPREDLRALLIKDVDEQMSPAEFHGNEIGMKALGLIPRDLNLKETMIRIYTEEIAAFYDTKTETMHLIREPAAREKKAPSLIERLFGKKTGFDKDENKTVIAHELTHALADQNFDIDALQASAKGDDDRDLALSALVEGEATLTMFGAQMSDWDGSQISHVPSQRFDRALGLISAFMPMSSGPSLREAPEILSETLMFPYFRGLVFCARLTNDGGWKALDDAYHAPPLSTEQILHPEKFRAEPDPPTVVDLGKLEASVSWTEVGRNVVGEMQLAVMLRKHGGKPAAAGWDGDCFAAFEGADDRLGLVWLSTWDTETDAQEFVRAYVGFQTTKLGSDIPQPDAIPDCVRRPNKGAIFAVERRGLDVAVVEGFPSEATEPLVEAAFRAKKTEKTHATVVEARKEGAKVDH